MMWFCSFADAEMGGANCTGDYDVITFLPRYYDTFSKRLSITFIAIVSSCREYKIRESPRETVDDIFDKYKLTGLQNY